ncbi:hypothetical protein FV222_07685 [Methylobacterium sp. WL103]|uniref:hypothetical protein n=1 Tax=Methylobacterium sp. WL103 TaxID=2603891 RepID=UPI0011C96C69|nr:hypothetical protein [Methylobacterium sp. WL103]TXN04281.1 hypothetical protein FV222_07685 [Methylobacterium sp. WL103]
MKRALVALALMLGAQTCLAAPSMDEEEAEMVQGLVRIVGAQAGITLYCRKAYAIDDKVSEGLLRTVRPTLDKAIGHRQAQAAIDEEGQRLSKEIADIGAERWCADQRDILNTDGIRVFLD